MGIFIIFFCHFWAVLLPLFLAPSSDLRGLEPLLSGGWGAQFLKVMQFCNI